MNQNRIQRYPAALLAWLGLILGFSFGLFLDQAANLPFNGNLLPALRACNYCVQAALPVVAEAIKVNRWTLLGSILGLVLGVILTAWLRLRPQAPASQSRRLSSMRQAAELARFSRALSDTLELPAILNQLHDEVLRITDATCGSSFLLDPESPEHRVAIRLGEGAELHRLSAMETAAVSSGHGRIVVDFEAEGEAPPHVGVRSAMLAPILHEENAIGLVHLHSDQPNAFDTEFYDFVQVLAAQAAVAIQNSRRYAEQSRRSEGLRQRVNQLQQLSQIPNAVRIDRPLTTNLKAIAQTMQETADFSLVLVSVFAAAGNQLIHTASAGLPPETFESLQHLPLPWERLQPFLREENRSDRVYRVPHTQTADLFQALDLGRPRKPAEPSAPGQWHPDDLLLVPLYGSRGEIEGLLSVGMPRDMRTAPNLLLEMLEIFASQAALAIENAHLITQSEERVSESQERAVQLGVLTEAAGVIAAALHVDEVVTLSLDQLRRVIPYDTATFWQRDLSAGGWRVLGARSFQDTIERVVDRIASAQATVFSEIVATRGVVFITDVSRDERFRIKEASSMRSWLGVPVLGNGEVLGILALEKGEDNFYGPAQVPLALSFANRVAAAMDNAHLYEESVARAQDLEKENSRRSQDVEVRSQRLALLNHIATDLAQARDIPRLLRLTLETLTRALGVEQASGMIITADAARESADVLATDRLPADIGGASATMALTSNALLDRLQETGVPLAAEAGNSTTEGLVRPEHYAWIGSAVSAALFVPLMAEGRLLGVIGLGGRPFSVADSELSRAVVQQTVTALQYLQLRDRTQEQAGVQQLTRAIGRASDFNQLYQVIRLQLAEVAGIQSFSLALYDSARNRLSFPLLVEKGQTVALPADSEGRTPGGIAGQIARSRQPVRLSGEVVTQAKALGLSLGLPDQHPVRGGPEVDPGPVGKAYLGVPLTLGDKLIGVLVAHDLERPDAFDERTERLLAASSSQIALAIDNLSLFDQARQTLSASQERATQFETLTEAAVALGSTLHSDEVISAALDQMQRMAPYDTATFWQREPAPAQRRGAAARWRAAAVRGHSDAAARTGQSRTMEPRTPLGDVVAARRSQVVPDVRQDARFEKADRGSAWMGVPVISQGEVVALVELEKTEVQAFTTAQIPLAQALAARVALALNNAEQYETSLKQKTELSEQARRQSIISRAAIALSGVLDLGEVLSTTARLLAEALNVDRAGAIALDEAYGKPVRAARLPAVADAGAALAPNALFERLQRASTVVTLDELSTEQPVPPEQTTWVGGGIAAGLFRPLVFKGRTVGLVGAGHAARESGRAFTTADISLAQDLCRLAAAALYEARQYEVTQEQLGEQALVNQIARAISQALDARQLGQLLRAQLDAWLAPAGIWLALYDEVRHEVSFALAVAAGQTISPAPQAPNGLLRQIMQSQQPLLLPGGDDLAQQLHAVGLGPEALAPARSYLGVPLILGSAETARVVGVLALADPVRLPRLTESHQRVLAALAVQVAISLDNARLYAVSLSRVLELDERAQRMAWLNRTAAELGGTLALNAVLPVALRALTELLPAEQAGVLLFDDSLETGRVVARWPLAPERPVAQERPGVDAPPVGAADKTPALFSLAGQGWWERLLPRLRESPAPLPLTELSADPGQPANPLAWLGARFTSALLLPLHTAAGLIGLIALGRGADSKPFSGENIEFSSLLVGHIVAALDNSIQYERSQDRLSELALVGQFSRALSRTLDLHQLTESLQAQMEAWLGPARLTLALFDDARREVSFPLVVLNGQAFSLGPRVPTGVLLHILHSQQPLLWPDPESINAQLQALGIADEGVAGARAFLGVPLVLADRVVGALTLADPSRVPTFDQRHLRSLVTLATQVALTIENARLYEMAAQATATAQQRAAQLGTLAESLAVITAGQRVPEVIDLALEQVQLLLPYAQAAFWRPAANNAWALQTTRRGAAAGDEPAHPVLPEALATQIITTRAAVLVPNARADERFAGPTARPAAWLGVPVFAQNELAGILALESAEAEGYQPAQLPLARAFAQQTGIALDSARRYEASLARAQEFERRGGLLARTAAEFSGNLDLNSLLAVSLRSIAEPLGADQAAVLIYASPDRTVDLTTLERPLAWAQFPPTDSQASTPTLAGNPLFERLRQTAAPLAVENLPDSTVVTPEQAEWVGPGLQSAVFFPLLVGGRPVGALSLGYASPRAFSAADLDLGQILAGQAASAYTNALRFFDIQQRLNEQSIVNQVIRAVGRAGDLQQLIDILRARMGSWVPSDSIALTFYDEAHNEATVPLWVENGRAREMAPFVPGGLLRYVLQIRRALRLGGDVLAQCRELGIPISFITHQPLRWTSDPGDVLTADSYLGVPILFGDKALGVLAVEAFGRAQAFDERHERILATIAAQVAMVMDSRRIFEQTSQALSAAQDRVTQLEALAAALSVIASALYSEDVVGVTLEQFERAIPYDRAAFWRREAGAGAVRELRWRAADARGYPDSPEQLTQALVSDSRQLAVFAELVSTRRIISVPDTAQDPRFAPGAERPTHSWLGVPLVNKGEVIGLLIAEKAEPNAYRASHATSAQILANQITAVLTNTYEYEESVQRVLELDERSRRLAFLNRFAAELGGNLNVGSILQLTLQALSETLGVDQATAAVFDETRNSVLALEHYPEIRGTHQLALPGSSLIERLQETPAPITIEDLAGPEAPARLRQADWIGQEVRAAMFLPLMSAGKLVGVIGLGQSEAGRRFTPGETELSMGLANLAAVAAQNARLYDRTQQRLAEQAGINQITRALSQNLEPRALFANLREQIDAWVGADRIFLAAYDESRNEVSFPLAEAGGQALNLAPRAPTGLVRHLLQQLEPVRLNGEIAQRLNELGLYDTGLGTGEDLAEAATWTSCLAVPLVNDEQVAGALILANPKRAETFDESHERVLGAVGAHIAAAMGQARQFEQSRQITLATQARAAQLSMLSEAATVMASALRSDQATELTLDQLMRVIPYDQASLWRRDGADGPWQLAAQRGQRAGIVGQLKDLAQPEMDPLAELAAARRSLVIADAAQDARFAERQPRPGSWLGFPLVHQGRLLGLVALEKTEAHAYGPAQATLALAFANQAAVTLANVRQFEDSLQRAFELDQRSTLLNRASANLSQAVEPRDVLVAALQALAEALGTAYGAAILFDEGGANTRARISARIPSDKGGADNLPLAANVLLEQLRTNLTPVAAVNVAADKLILPEYAAWIGPDIQSALFVPLVVAGRLIGLMGLGDSRPRAPFTSGQIELAMTLANQAAIAAHNASLFRATQRRLTELAAITQSSRAISQTIDLKPVFENVREQLESNLHADNFYLALYDEANNQVSFPLVVEQGQRVERSPRAPDRVIAYVLETQQSLTLMGDLGARLAQLGLLPAGSSETEVQALVRAKAFLGMPLVSGHHVVGVLALEDFQRAFAFTEKHERSVAAIAAPVAAAVEGARLYADSAQRALALDSRSTLLGRLSAQLSETNGLADLVQVIARSAVDTLLTDVGAAILLDETPGATAPLASARFPDGPTTELPVFAAASNPVLKQLQTALAPVTLDELSRDPQVRAEITAWLGADIGAALFLPLIVADKLIGLVAAAQLGHPRAFNAGEVDLAMSLANQAAVAAANASLHARLQPRLQELSAISRTSQAIGGVTSLAQLCDVLATEISRALGAPALVLALYDAASDAFSFPLLLEGERRLTASPRAPGGLLAHVLRRRASLLLTGLVDAQLEQMGLTYEPILADTALPRSYLAVPLILGSQVIGVLAAEDQQQAGHFTQSHEFILNTIAGPVAMALDNLRLQAERETRGRTLNERAGQLALLNRLGTTLMGSLEPEAILRRTLEELNTAVPADTSVGLLFDPASPSPRVALAVRWPSAAEPPNVPLGALEGLLQALSPGMAPLAVPDLAQQPNLTPEHYAWLAAEARSLLLLPLIVDEKLTGLMVLARSETARPFLPGEVEIAATCASQAALALTSARLHALAGQAQHAAEAQTAQFSLLTEAGAALSAASSVPAVISAALAQLARALPYDSLMLYRPNDGRLRLAGSQSQNSSALPLGPVLEPDYQAFIAETLAASAPVVAADAQHDSRFATAAAGAAPTPRSWLGIPLGQGPTALGVIVLAKAEPEVYQDVQVALAAALASLVATALVTAEQHSAASQQAGDLQIEFRQQAEHSLKTQRQLEEVSALNEQNRQRADSLANQLREQETALVQRMQEQEAMRLRQIQDQEATLARLEGEHTATAQDLQGQLRQQTEALHSWRARAAELLQARNNGRQPVSLEAALSRELLVGSQALAADAGAIYLAQAENGPLARRMEFGLVESLPPAIAAKGGLVAAAVSGRETIVVDDLVADARWGADPARAAAPASGNGANGAGSNGHTRIDDLPAGDEPDGLQAPGANGHYRSALVLPLVSGDRALGALLFLSARPAAFGPANMPVAQAAASQIMFALQSNEHEQAWRKQSQAIEQWLADFQDGTATPEPGSVPTHTLPIAAPAAQPVPPTPAIQPAQPVAAVPVSPAASAAPARPANSRRLALEVAALLLLVCLAGAALLNRDAIQQAAGGLLGGSATATPPVATVVVTQPSQAAPTLPAATLTVAPVTQAAPTQAPIIPTATSMPATLTPAPTASPLPSASPTEPLPPGVIGLATVVLPDGIVGRLRDAPNGNVVGGVPGNIQVQILPGRQTTPDNIVWVHIKLTTTGQSGWFSEGLLKYTATPVP